MMKNVLGLLLFFLFVSSANAAWQLRQVKINHVQAGNEDYFYMTVDGDVASASGCQNMAKGLQWVGFSLSNMDERKKILVSLAIAAYASGKRVDIGSTTDGCISSGTAHLQFIRLGDYLQQMEHLGSE